MVRRLERMGELSKETIFIDGTKLEACANKYTFVWKKSLGKWEENMFLKIQEAVTLLNQEYLQAVRIKKRCSRAKGNKRLYISKSFLEKRQESYENILSEKGILYRMNRSNGFTFFRFLISSLISTRLERFSSLLQVVHVSVNLQAHWIKCRPL